MQESLGQHNGSLGKSDSMQPAGFALGVGADYIGLTCEVPCHMQKKYIAGQMGDQRWA